MTAQSTIVVIDDNEPFLERIRVRLEGQGHRVITTTQTVGTARRIVGAQLVIIDWHMPGISGGELMKSFRAAVAHSTEKPLFYLYSSDTTVFASAKDMGFDGVFVNKGKDDSLLRQVAAALAMSKLRSRS
jgi:CheY-like chemotaxis protein